MNPINYSVMATEPVRPMSADPAGSRVSSSVLLQNGGVQLTLTWPVLLGVLTAGYILYRLNQKKSLTNFRR